MADLHFVDSALIPGPVRKEKQFRLPDDFSEFYFTILSRKTHAAFGFPALFRDFTSRTDRCSAIRKMFYTTRAKEGISTCALSEKSSLSTSRFNVKGKISGGIKGFLASKASILSTKYCLSFVVYCPPCLFFKKLFMSFGRLSRFFA